MPLPSPKGKTSQEKFISSCMANPTMNKEYPDQKQRAAVCYSQWKRAKKRKESKGEKDPEWGEQDFGDFTLVSY